MTQPYVANTDKAWFDYLGSRARNGRVDEVNFWSPRSVKPLKSFTPGEPVFLRLKSPHRAIAGYGFFAAFTSLGLGEAWEYFGWKNGDPDEVMFRRRLGRYRGVDLLDPRTPEAPMGCTVLRDVRFWSRERWIAWRREQGWAANIVRGKTERDPARAALLIKRIARDADHDEAAREWTDEFHLVDADARRIAEARRITREGQGAFRTRLLDSYGRRCAITGERTEPVLDAAHIQPYLGPLSNHVQNGLLMTKEFHRLFDLGLVTVTPKLTVKISAALRDRWHNGRRFYAYDGLELSVIPPKTSEQPSLDALAWHNKVMFQA